VRRFEAPARRSTRDNDSELATDVLEELLRLAGDQRLVLLIDNVQLVFERLSDLQQHALREVLMRPGGPIVVAAAPAPVLQTQDYSAAFYDQFKTHYLAPLTADDMRNLLRELAQAEGREDVARQVAHQSARVQTLHLLTGGNPRAVVLLLHLYLEGLSSNVYADLEGVLDMATPLYKARFDEFPPQMQVVAGAIAEHWDPCTARQVADETSLALNQVQPQLDRLQKLGFIEPVSLSRETVQGWQIGERFFNVWYLMRLASRRRRRGVEFLTRFLEAFFELGDRERFARELRYQMHPQSDHLLMALSVADSVGDLSLRGDVHRQVELTALQIEARDARRRMEEVLGLADLPAETLAYVELKNKLATLAGADSETEGLEFAAQLLGNRGLVFGRELPKLAAKGELTAVEREVLREACKAQHASDVERFGAEAVDWLERRLRSGQIRSVDDVEDWTRTIEQAAVEVPAVLRLIWNEWPAGLFNQLPHSAGERLVKATKPGNQVNGGSASKWFFWAIDCNNRRLHELAEQAYRQAIALNPKDAAPWNNLGNLLQDQLGRYEESEAAYRQAIALDPKYALPWHGLGNLLQDQLGRYEESEAAYRQ
ncbi:MAG: tetratricopeptide repeat protein, partial [Planctomycetota bacterium]|nr:tetratricopeptide repeat protein [Planctomycetota bacterium]